MGSPCNARAGLQQFAVQIDVASFATTLALDLGSWNFDDRGLGDLPFDLGLSVTSDYDLPITGGISLSFEFGLDSYSNFFIADPFVRADLSIGDDGFQVAVNEDPGTGDMSLAWDSATGEVYLSGNAAGLLAVDDAVVIMDDQGELSSWIVVAVDPYDVGSDRTRLVLGPEDGESMLSENAFSATVRRGFDVAINLGIFGLTVNNGFVDFDAGLEFGLDGKLNTAGLNSGGGLDQIDPRVGGDFEYAVYLPVELGGVLAGLNDNQGFITAFSQELPGDAGLKELIFSIPQTVRVTGLAELLEMRGISLDMILAALELALDDLVGVDAQLFGRLVGGQQLETFQQAWVPTNTTATGYAPVLDPVTLLPQSQVVLIDQVKSLRLYLWDDNGTQVWGHETGPESSEVLQVYAQRWQSTGVYDTDDFTTINGAPTQTGVTLADGTTGVDLVAYRLQTGSLYDDVPLIGVSVADVLGNGAVSFAAGLRNAIQTVRSTASNLDELSADLNQQLRTFLGLAADVEVVQMQYADSAFQFDFNLGLEKFVTYDLNLDVEQLGLDTWLGFNPADLVNLDIEAELSLQALASLNLGFGFDLSDVTEPLFHVDPDTGVSGELIGQVDDLQFNLGFDLGGPTLGLVADGGTATVDLGFYANLGDPAADTDGDGYLELSELGGAFQAQAYGSATIDLPLYFPIRALPLGGTEADGDGDGIGDNVLHAEAEFSVNQQLDFTTSYAYVLPDFSFDLDVATALIALLNDPATLLSGLEGFFTGIDRVASGIDSIELPLIGGGPFDDLADSLRSLRTSVLGDKSGSTYSNGLGKWLQDADASGDQTFDAILNEVRTALFNGLSPLNDPMFGFVVPDYDEYGALQYDDNGKLVTRLPQSPDDIELLLSTNGLLTFNLKFGGTLVDGEIPIDFSAGIPGVNLDIDAALQAEIDYVMGLGLGIGNLAAPGGTPSLGVFLDTSGINTAGEEIALDIDAGLVAGSTAVGTLGFLKMSFTDVNENGGSGIHGHLGLDIADASGDGKWRIGEGIELAMNASAYAEADLYAVIDTVAGEYLPSVSTTIRYDQQLADITISTEGPSKIDVGSPQVVLEQVTLDVGSLFDSFLGDTFSTIYDIVKPIKPVVDLLLMDIDLGVLKVQFIDIAYLRLPAKVVDTAKKVLEVLKATIDFLEQVNTLSDAGSINFGDFNLTERTLEDPHAATSESDVAGAQSSSGLSPEHANLLKGPSQKGLDNRSTTKSGRFGVKKTTGKRFQIPVLEDPISLVNFILGRGDADLFWYDLPDLELDFEYRKSQPIFAGLNGVFYGKISAFTNFDFGFDTRGLRQWMDQDFDLAESWRIFNGFYLDDHGQENTPDDLDEVVIQAGIGAGASLGIGGLVEAGVIGGIEANIGFNLNDKETDFLNDLPIGDGKLYGSELVERITQGPECLFDVHGQLKAFLEAFLWVGIDIGFSTITIFEASKRFVDEVLAEFSWECTLDAPHDIADQVGDELTLRYQGGPSSAYNYKVDVLPIDHDLTLANLVKEGYLDTEYYDRDGELELRNQLATLRSAYPNNTGEVILVSTGLKAEVFLASSVNKVIVTGTNMNDRYSLKRLNGRVAEIEIETGEGDDVVQLFADAEILDDPNAVGQGLLSSLTIDTFGGSDYVDVDSMLLGTPLPTKTYRIDGGAGNDRLQVAGVNDLYEGLVFVGGTGDDVIFGGRGIESVYGDAGFDVIATYEGADTIYGGDEDQDTEIATYFDSAGKLQVSEIYKANGRPFPGYDQYGRPLDENGNPEPLPQGSYMLRSFHGDVIDAGDGDDYIDGGEGFDEIVGGEGFNQIFGRDGNDVIDAGTGASSVDAGAGDDTILWVYEDLNGTLSISGNSGDNDTLQVTLNTDPNTVELTEGTAVGPSSPGEMHANLRIVKPNSGQGGVIDDMLVMSGIENLKLDVSQEADSVDIGDLMPTALRTVDLQLGSRKATMWQPERGGGWQLPCLPDGDVVIGRC